MAREAHSIFTAKKSRYTLPKVYAKKNDRFRFENFFQTFTGLSMVQNFWTRTSVHEPSGASQGHFEQKHSGLRQAFLNF